MWKHLLAISAFGTSVLLVPASAHAQAAHDRVTQDIAVNDIVSHPCTGEDVAISGIIRFRMQETFTPAGGLFLILTENNQGISGVSAGGRLYELVGSSTLVETIPELLDPQETFSITTTQLFIAQGAADDFHVRQHIHVTVNDNGTTVVFSVKFEGICIP